MRTLMLTGVLCAVCSAATHGDYRLEAREAIHHTFAKDTTLDVDVISGEVVVIGDSADSIRVEGEKIMRASSQDQLDRARREVALDANERDGIAQLYVNGPFRRNNSHAGEDHGFHSHDDDRHYDVSYNLTAHVPRGTMLRLRSVNGSIKTENSSGNFDVHTVNGGVRLTGIAGSGPVETVNGTVVVSFRENPGSDCSFKSVNGRIEVSLQPNVNADMAFKTFNGQAFTDFDGTMLATPPGAGGRDNNGRFVYKAHGFRSIRVGNGGPELKFETLNGNINVTKARQGIQ